MSSTSRQDQRRNGARASAIWVGAAALCLLAAVGAGLQERGRERIAMLLNGETAPSAAVAGRDQVALLSAELNRLRSETRLLAAEKEALAGKLGQAVDGEASSAAREIAAETSGPVRIEVSDLPLGPESGDGQLLSDQDILASLAELTDPTPQAVASQAVPPPAQDPGDVMEGAQFALELGVADSAEVAEGMWRRLSEEAPQVLGDLEPVVAETPGRGGATRYRLLAGPFANAATALNACVELTLRGIECEPAAHEGQALVMQ